jgi:hypothetical protein
MPFSAAFNDVSKRSSLVPASADPALKEGLVNAYRKLDYFTKFDQSRYYGWAACQFPSHLYYLLSDSHISFGPLYLIREDYADDEELQHFTTSGDFPFSIILGY